MSIDNCYETVIKKLTSQKKIEPISKNLLSIQRNDERVLYVFDIIKELHLFPRILNVNKCQTVSTRYRNQGNKCFQNSEDYKAWQYYNLSLLHAPLNSEVYVLALANRSAVFYSMKKYNECLEDVRKVVSMNYPEKLKTKLEKRKMSCKEALDQEKKQVNINVTEILKLKVPKDPRYLSASSKLEVVFSEDLGRHVVAKENINVGEILVEERPYISLLLKSQFLFSCSHCLSRKLNLLPCEHCCFSFYCSEQCRNSAWKEHHSVECPLMATLVHMAFTKLELLALRTVIKARSQHTSWQSLFKTIEKAEENANNEFRGHVSLGDKWVYDSQYYESIHMLASNVDKRSISDIFQKSVSAAVFLHLLVEGTKFLKPDADDKEIETIRRCAAGMLLLHIMTSPTNMHGVYANEENYEGNFVNELSIGSGAYAFLSLLNHSCAPNVVRYNELGTANMNLCALRPIKKGMQLLDNYGSHHALEHRNERQKHLKFQYKFTCLCEACINDWPTYLSLPRAKNLPLAIRREKETLLNNDTIEKLQKGVKATALTVFKPLCELAKVLEPFAPCMELADCQESLKQCIAIFEGLVPYGYSQLVQWDAVPHSI